MNRRLLYRELDRIVLGGASLEQGVETLIALLADQAPHPLWARIQGLDHKADQQAFSRWIKKLWRNEPPSPSVNALNFGLFTAADDPVAVAYCCLYVTGGESYKPADVYGDFEAWMAEERYAKLPTLKRFSSWLENLEEDDAVRDLGTEFLCLGYAGLLVQEACRGELGPLLLGGREHRYVTTGFDEGDTYLLGALTAQGWCQRQPETPRKHFRLSN